MTKKDVIVHIHIFKNAGSSFDSSLRENFGKNFVDHRDDADIVKGKEQYLMQYLKAHQNINAFSSHSIHFQPQSSEAFSLHPIYFLRHPIERIKSVYSFEKKQEPVNTKGARKAKDLSFDDYIKWYMEPTSPATIRNIQTIFLSGEGPAPYHMEEKYFKALNTLSNLKNLIGVVDRYDESAVVFEEALKATFPSLDLSYIRRNVTDTDMESTVEAKSKKLLETLPKETQTLVIANNNYDMELYEKANILLDQNIAKIANFKVRLNNFKDRCMVKQLRLFFNKKSYIKVIDIVNEKLKEGTRNPSIYLMLIESLMAEKKFGKALQICEKTMENLPKNPWAYFAKVEALHLNGNKKKAKELFETVSKKFADKQHIVKQYAEKLGL
ncbi:MAG: sulfotransferase family 2 domain-containing protein [Bacteroidales bacterium]|nr:sulfotransferase family 2 domain-containing protein [Bacteroidales bacterium]